MLVLIKLSWRYASPKEKHLLAPTEQNFSPKVFTSIFYTFTQAFAKIQMHYSPPTPNIYFCWTSFPPQFGLNAKKKKKKQKTKNNTLIESQTPLNEEKALMQLCLLSGGKNLTSSTSDGALSHTE